MKEITLKLRVLPEGFFLWFGGIGLYFTPVHIIEPRIETKQGDDLFYVLTAVPVFAAAMWILVGREKKRRADITCGVCHFRHRYPACSRVGACVPLLRVV